MENYMKTTYRSLIFVGALTALFFSSCSSSTASPTVPVATTTPDPCAPENIRGTAETVHEHMREFDDSAAIAANSKQNQLADPIADLQRIRRNAQDQNVPQCLAKLKELQLQHMNTVINTLLAFMGGANQDDINKGIELARQQHDAYSLELAHVIGLTLIVVTPTTGSETPPADSSPAPSETPAQGALMITNPGPAPVNLRRTPGLDGETIGTMDKGGSAPVKGKTADGLWLMIELPNHLGQMVWVYTPLVDISGQTDYVPVVVSPTP
jgi:hypothetical protein